MKDKKDIADLIDDSYIEEYQEYALKHCSTKAKRNNIYRIVFPAAGVLVAGLVVVLTLTLGNKRGGGNEELAEMVLENATEVSATEPVEGPTGGDDDVVSVDISELTKLIDNFNESALRCVGDDFDTWVLYDSNNKVSIVLSNEDLPVFSTSVSYTDFSQIGDTFAASGFDEVSKYYYSLRMNQDMIYIKYYNIVSSQSDAEHGNYILVKDTISAEGFDITSLKMDTNYAATFIDLHPGYTVSISQNDSKYQVTFADGTYKYVVEGNVERGVLVYTKVYRTSLLESSSSLATTETGYVYFYENSILWNDTESGNIIPFTVKEADLVDTDNKSITYLYKLANNNKSLYEPLTGNGVEVITIEGEKYCGASVDVPLDIRDPESRFLGYTDDNKQVYSIIKDSIQDLYVYDGSAYYYKISNVWNPERISNNLKELLPSDGFWYSVTIPALSQDLVTFIDFSNYGLVSVLDQTNGGVLQRMCNLYQGIEAYAYVKQDNTGAMAVYGIMCK